MVMIIRAFFLRLEAAAHSVDAYLFRSQGKFLEAADAECRALECERAITNIKINARFSNVR